MRRTREIYEQACLAHVMKGLVGLNREDNLPDQRRLPYYVHEIRLSASYPDTKLVPVISRLTSRGYFEWGLWGDDFGQIYPNESNRASPEHVASAIMIAVHEFA